MSDTRTLFPFAICANCGWHGRRDEMMAGPGVLDECCPECKSDDTEWTDVVPPTEDAL